MLKKHGNEIFFLTFFCGIIGSLSYTLLASNTAIGLPYGMGFAALIALICGMVAFVISYLYYVEFGDDEDHDKSAMQDLAYSKEAIVRVKEEVVPKGPLEQSLRHFSSEEMGASEALIQCLEDQGYTKLGDLSDFSEVRLRSIGFSKVQAKKFTAFLKKIKSEIKEEKEKLLPNIDQQSRILEVVDKASDSGVKLLATLFRRHRGQVDIRP